MLFERHEGVAKHHVHRHGAEEIVLDAEILQIDEFTAIAQCKRLRARCLVLLDRDKCGCCLCHDQSLVTNFYGGVSSLKTSGLTEGEDRQIECDENDQDHATHPDPERRL